MTGAGDKKFGPGSGNGWSVGPGGVPVWGLFGAAGLFILAEGDGSSTTPSVLLQHRASWTNNGDTWGVPGGARDGHESPEEAAVRETVEECGIDPADIEILHSEVTAGPYPQPDRPEAGEGWAYTTVIARTRDGRELETTANEESFELRWVPLDEVKDLPLIPPFRVALPRLREILHRVLE